jgi:hypothetical protein
MEGYRTIITGGKTSGFKAKLKTGEGVIRAPKIMGTELERGRPRGSMAKKLMSRMRLKSKIQR